ncbi:hypothetical protein D3C72_1843420 [compost metagenome]
MQEAGLVAIQLDARGHGLVRIDSGGGIDHQVIGPRWNQDAHIHAAQHGQPQHRKHRLVGHEIRRRDPQPVPRRLDRLDKEQRTGLLRVGRA